MQVKASDNGSSMSEEVKCGVFGPFFTTQKEKTDGVGLSAAWGDSLQAQRDDKRGE